VLGDLACLILQAQDKGCSHTGLNGRLLAHGAPLADGISASALPRASWLEPGSSSQGRPHSAQILGTL
jgi:hypothetical protein